MEVAGTRAVGISDRVEVGEGVGLAVGVEDTKLACAATVIATAVLTASKIWFEDATEAGPPQALRRTAARATEETSNILFILSLHVSCLN